MKKYILFATLALAAGIIIATPVFAVTPTQSLSAIKSNFQKTITAKITHLQNLVERITATKNLSEGQKTALISSLNAEISELSALKNKVAGDKDTATAQKDIKELVSAKRAYSFLAMQISTLGAADRAKSIANSLDLISAKLQARILTLPDGEDKTALQKSYTDLAAKIAGAKTKAESAITAVLALKADAGDNTEKQNNLDVFKDARDSIKSAKQDFVSARKTAGEIAKTLKSISPKEKEAEEKD